MEPFKTLTARAAPLLKSNVDTEVIIPIGRLIGRGRGELGPYCFEPWRYAAGGEPDPQFVLNTAPFSNAQILVTLENFGCGSSREAAVWALWDMGFRCIIATSFGDIFRANCFQNGLLPITLEPDTLSVVMAEVSAPAAGPVTVDLAGATLRLPSGRVLAFQIDPERRIALLEGLDETGLTLKYSADIAAFQEADRRSRPWAYPTTAGQ
jgi:3-isopropylmalate/(R)-2-methylmalate dehydratase small subunit